MDGIRDPRYVTGRGLAGTNALGGRVGQAGVAGGAGGALDESNGEDTLKEHPTTAELYTDSSSCYFPGDNPNGSMSSFSVLSSRGYGYEYGYGYGYGYGEQ